MIPAFGLSFRNRAYIAHVQYTTRLRRICAKNGRTDTLNNTGSSFVMDRFSGSAPLRLCSMMALLALCLSLFACSSGDPKQQRAQAAGPRAVSVAIAPVQQQDMPVYLSGLGSVTAFNTANIKSRVDGQIMRVNVREGQN